MYDRIAHGRCTMFARIPRRMLRRVLLSVAAALPLVALAGPPTMAGSGLATITILHGLPKVTADVYVNGKLTLDGFEPESATGALSLPAGDYDVAIREVGSSPTSDPAL